MPVELQVLSVYAGTSGALDDLEIGDIRRFENDLHEWFQARHGAMVDQIRDTGTLPDSDDLASALAEFKESFAAALLGEEVRERRARDPRTDDDHLELAPFRHALDPSRRSATRAAFAASVALAQSEAVRTLRE